MISRNKRFFQSRVELGLGHFFFRIDVRCNSLFCGKIGWFVGGFVRVLVGVVGGRMLGSSSHIEYYN